MSENDRISGRRRFFLMTALMVAAAMIVGGLATAILYQTGLDQQRARLIEIAQSQARLMEAMARHDAIFEQGTPGGSEAATLSQVIDAHDNYAGFGETGEFTLARIEGEDIIFLLSHRHGDLEVPAPISFDSELAEPMRQALLGRSGSLVGIDYRGVKVLAAYEPVAVLDLGIVAKIDMAEVRAPFIRAAATAGGVALVIVIIGVALFRRVSNPVIKRLERQSELLEAEVELRTIELISSNDQLERRNDLLQAIGQAQRQLMDHDNPSVMFDDLLNNTISLSDSEYGFIGEVLYSETGQPYLKTYAISNVAWNDENRELYDKQAANGLEFRNLATLFGAALTTGKPVIANDPANDLCRGGLLEGHPPLKAFLGVPLYSGDDLVGLIGVANRPGGYDEEIVEYLQPFLTTCGSIISAFRISQEAERAARDLVKSERNFRNSIDDSPVGTAVMTAGGRIAYANQAFLDIHGYDCIEELRAVPLRRRYTSQSYADYRERRAMVRRGVAVPERYELNVVRKSGEIRHLWVSAREITWDGDRRYLVICLDETERVRAERTLRTIAEGVSAATGEAFLHSLVEYLVTTLGVDYALIGRLVDGGTDSIRTMSVCDHGQIVDNFEYDLAGTPCGNVVGQSLCTYSRDVQRLFPEDHLIAEMGVEGYMGMPLFDSAGDPLGVMVVMTGAPLENTVLTETVLRVFAARVVAELERKAAEEGMRESQTQLLEAQKIARLASWRWDLKANTGTISEEACRLFGIEPFSDQTTPEELIRHIHPDDEATVLNAWRTIMVDGESLNFGLRTVLADGSARAAHVIGRIIRDEEGIPVRIDGTIQDISERVMLESKVVEYEELNEFKTNLLSTVSHELRTPMAIIKGYSTLMLDYGDRLGDAEKDEYLTAINRATNRLTELVDHILDMSRLESGLLRLEKARSSLSRIIREAVSEAKLRAPGHSITWKSNGRLPRVMVDARRIRQVLDNILDNAIKYSAEGTTIAVSAEVTPKELLMAVTDEGVGIPREDLEKIFERMYRVENRPTRQTGGVGLGLAICKGLVEAHGGRIWMESDEGKGSTCYFAIPV